MLLVMKNTMKSDAILEAHRLDFFTRIDGLAHVISMPCPKKGIQLF
jgi:hypothetical protein